MAQTAEKQVTTDSATDQPVVTPDDEGKDAVSETPKATPITVGRMGLAVEERTQWLFTVPQKVTPEQCMDEGYWQHVSMRFRAGDELIVTPDDMSWELVLAVIGCGNLYAHVIKKVLYDLKPLVATIKLPPIYKVDYHGRHHKWRVLREGKMLRDGFETEALARRYAANHEAAVRR